MSFINLFLIFLHNIFNANLYKTIFSQFNVELLYSVTPLIIFLYFWHLWSSIYQQFNRQSRVREHFMKGRPIFTGWKVAQFVFYY